MTRRTDSESEQKSKLTFVRAGKFDSLRPPLDFIPGLFFDSTVGLIYSPPGNGKTFLALHLLCSTALGRPVFGLKTEQRNGLYVALEGEANIKTRIAAWCKQNGVEENPIHYMFGRFDLASADDEDVDRLIAYMKKYQIGFVVIDTLALAMVGLDEISGQHVGVVLAALHRIKSETGACVVAIDHTGKNERAGARGHSSKLGNVDTNIEIIAHNKEPLTKGNRTVTIEHPITMGTPRSLVLHKQRDGEGGGTTRVRFAFTKHETGFTNARGERMSSLALHENEAFADLPLEDEPQPRPLSPREQAAMVILAELSAKVRRLGPPDLNQFRRALKKAGWASELKKPDAWRKAWERLAAKLELDSNGAIERGL